MSDFPLFTMLLAASPPDRLLSAVHALPWGVHAGIAFALIAGLVLWCTGRRVLKPVVVTVAAAFAAVLGFILIPVLAPDAGVSSVFGAIGGGVIGLLAGYLLYRFVLAVTFGVTLAAGAAMVAAAALSLASSEHPLTPQITLGQNRDISYPPADRMSPDDSESAALFTLPPPSAPPLPTPLAATWLEPVSPKEVADSARDFVECLQWQANEAWSASSTRTRFIVGGAGVIGFLLGLLLGFSLPAWAAGVVTALVGAAVWLPSAVWLIFAASAPGREWLDLPPAGWTIVWFVVSLLGLAVQWAGLLKGKKSAPAR